MRYTLIMLLLLSGCSLLQKPPVKECPAIKLPLNLPNPPALNLEKPEIFILKDEETAMMCTDVDGYKSMAVNLSEILNYIRLQQSVIDAYKAYYEAGR